MSQGIEVVGADTEEEEKTDPKEPIVVNLAFDPKNQSIAIGFDKKKMKSWDFLLMMLEGARVQAEFQRTTRLNQKMAEAQMAQMQEQMLKQQLVAQQSSRRT